MLPFRVRHETNFKALFVAHVALAVSMVHGVLLDLSDAESLVGMGSRGLFVAQISVLAKRTTVVAVSSGRPLGRLARAATASLRNATWLILPVVICLSQRLSHACVSMN